MSNKVNYQRVVSIVENRIPLRIQLNLVLEFLKVYDKGGKESGKWGMGNGRCAMMLRDGY